MHITEEANDLRIHAPRMLCDEPLGEIPTPLPNKHFFMGVIGSAGSGKSSFMVSLLSQKGKDKIYRKVFENVFIVAPSHSLASLKSNVFRNHPEDKIYNELNPETLADIKEKTLADADEGFNSLVIFDDQTVHLKSKENERLLRDLIYNRRHYHLSIMILAQSYSQIPLTIRKTLSHFAVFKPRNKKELISIFDEIIFRSKEEADAIMRYTFQDKHDFMFGVTESGELYRTFNKLIVTD
jgi:hypothetical protein